MSSRDLSSPKPKSVQKRSRHASIDAPQSARSVGHHPQSSRRLQQGPPLTPVKQSTRRLQQQSPTRGQSNRHSGFQSPGGGPGRGMPAGGQSQRRPHHNAGTTTGRSQRMQQGGGGGGSSRRGKSQRLPNPNKPAGRAITAGFRVGQLVRLENLLTKSMNGTEGYVYEVTRERVNITIRDQFGVDYVAIQPKNLRILAQPKKSKTKTAGPDWAQYQRDTRQKNNKKKTVKEIKEDAQMLSMEQDDASASVRREEKVEYITEQDKKEALKKFAKDLKDRGLKPELLCEDADDAVSVITFSDQSYVMDLYIQKKNRQHHQTQEVYEEARGRYEETLKDGAEEDEAVFLDIFNEVMAEKEPIFKERDAIADERLDKELDRQKKLLEKKKTEGDNEEDNDDEEDFAYDEEELYQEIGQYEPVVKIPDPSTAPSPPPTKKSQTPASLTPDPAAAVDTCCNCTVM